MNRARLTPVLIGLILLCCEAARAGAGFSTRDLNPILQPVLLPTQLQLDGVDGWRLEHHFFLTNTLQQQTRGSEDLLIDLENYRYILGLGYRRQNWIAQVNLPFTASRGGQLDSLIEDWHDFFGFPQGKRNEFPRDQIRVEYVRDGVSIYQQDEASEGIGDISLALGYQASDTIGYFIALELATGSESDFSGNDAADLAVWLSTQHEIDSELSTFTLFGVSFPGRSDFLQGLLARQIWVAQLGLDYRFNDDVIGMAQLDLHSSAVRNSKLKAFGNSAQIQLGLGFENLIDEYRLDLFFSEDILVGSAPDISFGLRLARPF